MIKFFVILLMFFTVPYSAQDTSTVTTETELELEEDDSLELEPEKEADSKVIIQDSVQAVQYAIENNPQIRSARYDLQKTDSNYLKSQSKYTWRALAGLQASKQKQPFNQQNIFTGTKIHNDTISAGIDRMFETGTYFKIEGSTTRFDSNAFEEAATTPASFRSLGIGPLYTGKLGIVLSQELLKNSFGIQERNNQEMLKLQSKMAKNQVSYQISGLVVETLINYWQYLIQDESVKTYERLLKNTRDIRNLTYRKMNLGLAERFEINQWNALLSQAQSQVEKTKLSKEEARRKLLRTLNLPETTIIDNPKGLQEELPEDLNYQKDLEYAFANRSDWKNLKIQAEMAQLSEENAKNQAMPSLKATVSYGYQGQNLESPQKNFTDSKAGIPSFKYSEGSASLNLVYPINDPGVKVGIRDAYIQKKQVALSQQDKRREIEDEIQIRLDSVKTSHKILKNAIQTRKSTERYYYGLLSSFRRGRFTAVAVKNALDSLVQNELSEMRSKINFNIDLLRYDLAKNSILPRFGINEEKLAELE